MRSSAGSGYRKWLGLIQYHRRHFSLHFSLLCRSPFPYPDLTHSPPCVRARCPCCPLRRKLDESQQSASPLSSPSLNELHQKPGEIGNLRFKQMTTGQVFKLNTDGKVLRNAGQIKLHFCTEAKSPGCPHRLIEVSKSRLRTELS